MYDVRPNLIIGFHGCEASVRDELIQQPNNYKISQKPFDWLGHGLYFWENNFERALRWAQDKKKRGAINEPAVVGAVLQLGHCCDFTDSRNINLLTKHYNRMKQIHQEAGKSLPRNRDLPGDIHKDKIFRELDCAAIEFMHDDLFTQINTDIRAKGFSEYKIFDSTRGVFTEGGPAFEGAGLFAKSHIQICIRNSNCIKGFFKPRMEIDFVRTLLPLQRITA